MKKAAITRRGLARLLGVAAGAGAAMATGARGQVVEGRSGRWQRALVKLRKAKPRRSLSPAFRFLP